MRTLLVKFASLLAALVVLAVGTYSGDVPLAMLVASMIVSTNIGPGLAGQVCASIKHAGLAMATKIALGAERLVTSRAFGQFGWALAAWAGTWAVLGRPSVVVGCLVSAYVGLWLVLLVVSRAAPRAGGGVAMTA